MEEEEEKERGEEEEKEVESVVESGVRHCWCVGEEGSEVNLGRGNGIWCGYIYMIELRRRR